MKDLRPLILTLALIAVSAGALPAQQFIFGTQSAFATPPAVANTFGNDVAALATPTTATVVVSDAALHANGGSATQLNFGQASFFAYNSAAFTAPFKISRGSALTDYFSWDMVALGDVDGDGWEDVAIGAPQVGSGPGYVRAISGNPALLPPADVIYQVNGSLANGFFGGALDRIDIGLGGRDLLVAGIGTVEVRDDLTGGLLRGPITLPPTVSVVRSLKYFTERFSVRTIGDVNADTFEDFAVGNPSGDQVLVMSGNPFAFGATLATINAPVAGSLFGYSTAPMGDLDGDGRAEFLIGAPGENGNRGTVYLYDGATFAAISQFSGVNPNEFFGYSVDGGFDLDADGVANAIAGAPGDVFAGVAGYARTFTGLAPSGIRALTPFYLPTATPAPPPGLSGPVYGTNVAGLGDLNGDSFSEYAVGLPQDSAAAGGTGHNFVYAGGPLAATIAIGPGCSFDGTPPPGLFLLGAPFIGGTITPVVIDTFHPTTAGALFLGTAGTTPPCFDLVGATTVSNFVLAGGIAFLPPVPVPLNPGLLGARFRFQAAVLVPGGFNVSNSLEVLIGLQ